MKYGWSTSDGDESSQSPRASVPLTSIAPAIDPLAPALPYRLLVRLELQTPLYIVFFSSVWSHDLCTYSSMFYFSIRVCSSYDSNHDANPKLVDLFTFNQWQPGRNMRIPQRESWDSVDWCSCYYLSAARAAPKPRERQALLAREACNFKEQPTCSVLSAAVVAEVRR